MPPCTPVRPRNISPRPNFTDPLRLLNFAVSRHHLTTRTSTPNIEMLPPRDGLDHP